MEAQLPSLKKQNLNYAKFAGKSIQDLFSSDALDSCRMLTFNYPRSIIAFNRGNGKFDTTPLPSMVQLSSVNTIRSVDLNGDGSKDLVLCGNEFGFLPQFGRLDASCGNLLLNDGHGRFDWLEPGRSGLDLTGQVRNITTIKGKDQLFLLFLRNDEYPVLYKVLANKK